MGIAVCFAQGEKVQPELVVGHPLPVDLCSELAGEDLFEAVVEERVVGGDEEVGEDFLVEALQRQNYLLDAGHVLSIQAGAGGVFAVAVAAPGVGRHV